MATLPNELVENVLDNCSPHDLFHLATVNRRLSSTAYRTLYRIIPEIDAKRTVDFLVSICFYEHLGPLVRSLNLTFMGTSLVSSFSKAEVLRRLLKLGGIKSLSLRHVLRDRLTLLGAALKKLSNLVHLQLFAREPEGHNDNVERLLGKCDFQLKTFMTSLDFGPAMASFLRKQKFLVEFHFNTGKSSGLEDLPVGSLPVLNTLGWSRRTPVDVVKQLVEGRPVHNISVFLDNKTTISRILDIGEASKGITTACFIFVTAPTSENIEAIARQFPNLLRLRLNVDMMTEDIAKDLTASFTHFKLLERVTIAGYGTFVEGSTRGLKPVFQKWFDECESLNYIALPQYGFGIAKKSWYNKMGPVVGKRLIEESYIK